MKNPKTILITGASSGIGEALALHYAAPEVFLALSGRNEERLTAIADKCRVCGASVETALVNVTDKAAMTAWIEGLDDERPLDLVIANAGISGGTGGVMDGEPIGQAQDIFDVNLQGVLNTIHPVMERMVLRGRGQIALMSSLAGYRGFPGAPAYSASKGAVRFYGEALRPTLSLRGVAVNVICPGFIESRMTAVNKFPMPFLMSAEKAAQIIVRGLEKNRSRISFPAVTVLFAWLLSVLPDVLAQKLMVGLPAKGRKS